MSYIDKLKVILKYSIKETELAALRKARLMAIVNSPDKNKLDFTSPQDVANAGIKKWFLNKFTPTTTAPEPAHVILSDNEKQSWLDSLSKHGSVQDNHIGNFHNLAALIAGRIPATTVDKDFLTKHPVGKDLLSKAISQGNNYFHIEHPTGNRTVIGRPENITYIKQGLKDGQEHMVKRGLGYPESLIPKPISEEEQRVPF